MKCPECGGEFEVSIIFCPYDGAKLLDPEVLAQDPLLGTVIDGRYQVQSLLGKGGMGTVYRAEHMLLGKNVAVKLLKKDYCTDREVEARFKREARAACRIKNPHVVDISDYGALSDGRLYYAMELLLGVSLKEYIENHVPLSIEEVKTIALQVCEGMAAAHEQGIIHRDIKPENLFLEESKQGIHVKILDFGIAKSQHMEGKATLTRAGMVFGTPQYLSPEQANGEAVDTRSDVYSFGVVLYEMVTGQPPFCEESTAQLVLKHVTVTPMPPAEKAEVTPAAKLFSGIIMRALRKDPIDRYATFQDMARAIQAVSEGGADEEQSIAEPPEQPRVMQEEPPDAPPELPGQVADDDENRSTPPSKHGKPPLYIALGLVGVLLIALAMSFLETEEQQAPLPPIVASTRMLDLPADASLDLGTPDKGTTPDMTATFPLQILSKPSGAQVKQGDTILGTTPLDVSWPAEEVTFVVANDGYKPAERTVRPGQDEVIEVQLERQARKETVKGAQNPKPRVKKFKNPFQ